MFDKTFFSETKVCQSSTFSPPEKKFGKSWSCGWTSKNFLVEKFLDLMNWVGDGKNF